MATGKLSVASRMLVKTQMIAATVARVTPKMARTLAKPTKSLLKLSVPLSKAELIDFSKFLSN